MGTPKNLNFDISHFCYFAITRFGEPIITIYDTVPSERQPGRLSYILKQIKELMPNSDICLLVWAPIYLFERDIIRDRALKH